MSAFLVITRELFSDTILFLVLEVGLVAFVMFAVIYNWIQRRRAGRGGATLTVRRGDKSMGLFYASYAALSGLLITICLAVDVASNHRIFWVALDTLLIAYVCLVNPWFRNLLVGWAILLTKIEQR